MCREREIDTCIIYVYIYIYIHIMIPYIYYGKIIRIIHIYKC